ACRAGRVWRTTKWCPSSATAWRSSAWAFSWPRARPSSGAAPCCTKPSSSSLPTWRGASLTTSSSTCRPAPAMPSSAWHKRGRMLHKAIQQLFADVAWSELDYLIVDLPPGTGDAQLSLAQSVPLTGGVIVTGPQAVSVSDALRGAKAFERLEVPIIGVVENM